LSSVRRPFRKVPILDINHGDLAVGKTMELGKRSGVELGTGRGGREFFAELALFFIEHAPVAAKVAMATGASADTPVTPVGKLAFTLLAEVAAGRDDIDAGNLDCLSNVVIGSVLVHGFHERNVEEELLSGSKRLGGVTLEGKDALLHDKLSRYGGGGGKRKGGHGEDGRELHDGSRRW